MFLHEHLQLGQRRHTLVAVGLVPSRSLSVIHTLADVDDGHVLGVAPLQQQAYTLRTGVLTKTSEDVVTAQSGEVARLRGSKKACVGGRCPKMSEDVLRRSRRRAG